MLTKSLSYLKFVANTVAEISIKKKTTVALPKRKASGGKRG